MKKLKDWLKKRWKKLAVVAAAIVSIVTLTVTVNYTAHEVEFATWDNLLANPGFEAGASVDASRIWWWDTSGPYHNAFGEVSIPNGWNVWWRQDTPCYSGITFDKGRPEVQVIGKTDPERVHDGDQALKMFTFWRCHETGVFQQVYLEPGHYRFSIYAHAWHSNCSRLPHSMPYDDDCIHVLWDSWDRMKVGIGPEEVDPWGDEIVWSELEQYGVYGPELSVMTEITTPMTATVWFASECNYPLKHDDVYLDSAMLVRVHPVYLPMVVK